MNLFDGLFQRKSAFTKVKTDKNKEHEIRLGRTLEQHHYMISNSSPGSSEARNSYSYSSEPRSSSSENDYSMKSDQAGSLERLEYKNMTPLDTHDDNFMKKKQGGNPVSANNFGFLSG